MSIFAVAWALDTKVGDKNAKLVLISLAEQADNKTKKCWPSAKHLAERCEISERSIYRCIIYLQSKGLISVTHRRWPGGVKRSPEYTMQFPCEKPTVSLSVPTDTGDTRTDSCGSRRTITEPSLSKEGNGIRKEERDFRAYPGSEEFLSWKSYYSETQNRGMLRELARRELEGRPFVFATRTPPDSRVAG